MRMIIVIFIYVNILILLIVSSLAMSSSYSDMSIHTKAICNERNYCLDVQITCEDGKVVDIKPISEGVYFSNILKYIRSDSRDEWC